MPVSRDRSHDYSHGDGDEHREQADTHRDARAIHQPRPYIAPESVGAEWVKDAMTIGAEGRDEPRRHDIALRIGMTARDERCGDRAGQYDQDDEHAECAAAVAQQPGHVLLRNRGSTQLASTSASRLPATTRAALTAVAGLTSG